MNFGNLALSAALLIGVNGPPASADSITPTGIRFLVQNYTSGYCSLVFAGDPQQTAPLVDSCHGWRMSSCRGVVLVVSQEARLARGSIVRGGSPDSRGEVVEIIDLNSEIERRIAGSTDLESDLLDMDFGDLSCSGEDARISFEGSIVPANASGAGTEITGTIVVEPSSLRVEM